MVHDDDGYESVQFIAAKDEAIALFRTRLPLLAQLTGNHPDFHEHIAALLALVQSWEGQYLFLDDSEVMDMPAEESLPLCHAFFQSINQTPPDLALIVENLRVLESDLSIVRRDETEPDAFKRNLIGVFIDGEGNYSAPFYTIYGVCNCRNTICRSPNRIFAVYHSDKDQPKPHM